MTYAYIAAAGTYNIKQGSGRLFGIVVNTTAASTITIYNANSAVATAKIGTLAASVAAGTYNYLGVPFTTGLTVVPAGASDITVIFD